VAAPTTSGIQFELLELAGEAWNRLRMRLVGLDDAEYRWEPGPGCWTVRDAGDGTFRADNSVLPPDPAPFTTLAWRIAHLVDVLGQERTAYVLGLAPVLADDFSAEPTAAGAIARLTRAYDVFVGYVRAIGDDELWQPLGARGGPFAQSTRVAYVLHQLDELVHHGAEVGVVRDLYALTHAPAAPDPLVQALLDADESVVARAERSEMDRIRTAEPALVARAAAQGRWDAVRLLVELGFDVNVISRRTALHDAAGSGDLEMVRYLIEHGADPSVVEADFNATPAGWATYFRHDAVVDYLEGRI
jgi:DinB superfamily/Ankyrin repeats (3 copies)